MSVADADDTTATSSADTAGVPQHLLTESDFIGVRAALVQLVGNDGNRALVLTRILWRADSRWREAVSTPNGKWWWRATYDTIAAETGLTRKQVERCLRWLTDAGMVESEAHHVEGPYDQTRSYRVVVAHLPESGDDSAESGNVHRAESGNVPLTETFKTLPATLDGLEAPKRSRKKAATTIADDWQPTEAHAELAKQRGLDLAHEASLFRDHAVANDRRLADWNAGFRMWLGKSNPQPPRASGGGYSGPAPLPPAPRFPIAQANQYDPNYLQPRTPEQIAQDAAEQDAFRAEMQARRRASQQ